MSALVDDYFHLTPHPKSPNTGRSARRRGRRARAETAHVSRRLPACVRIVVFSHTPRSSWNGEVGEGIPTHPPSSSGENVDFGFSFSLCFFFLHFFFARMERMKGKENIIIGHMSLFHIRIRCGISPAAPSHTTTFAEPTLPLRLLRRARWD